MKRARKPAFTLIELLVAPQCLATRWQRIPGLHASRQSIMRLVGKGRVRKLYDNGDIRCHGEY